jgi:hypothetical protein
MVIPASMSGAGHGRLDHQNFLEAGGDTESGGGEAGRIGDDDWFFLDSLDVFDGELRSPVVWLFGADDLDEVHDVNRVEDVKADNAFWG